MEEALRFSIDISRVFPDRFEGKATNTRLHSIGNDETLYGEMGVLTGFWCSYNIGYVPII